MATIANFIIDNKDSDIFQKLIGVLKEYRSTKEIDIEDVGRIDVCLSKSKEVINIKISEWTPLTSTLSRVNQD